MLSWILSFEFLFECQKFGFFKTKNWILFESFSKLKIFNFNLKLKFQTLFESEIFEFLFKSRNFKCLFKSEKFKS